MKSYFKILGYGKENLPKVWVALAFLLLYNLFAAVSLTMVIPFLEILFSTNLAAAAQNTDTALKSQAYAWLAQTMLNFGKQIVLFWFCGVLFGAILLKNVFRYLSAYFIAPYEQGVIRAIRDRLFNHLTKLSLNFYTNKRKGNIMNIVINDVQIVQEAVVGTILHFISDPITMLIYLVTMFFISWELTLFTLLVLPLTGFAIAKVGKSLKKHAKQGQKHLDRLLSVIDEFITGIRVVKGFAAEAFESKKYSSLNAQYTNTAIKFRHRSELASPVTEVLSVLVIIVIMLYGGLLIIAEEGSLKGSEFIGFIAIFSQFLAPIKTYSGAISRIQKASVSFERISELLKEPVKQTESFGGIEICEFKTAIDVQNLSFAYGERVVLKDINFTVKRGQVVALVGPSGSGKTTLADLICRFYDPTEGRILIDGQDLRTIDGRALRRLMGVVSQEGILFNDTLFNNIAYGDDNNYFTLADVEKAARTANAHCFIVEAPEGYQTVIGERGTRLSGGQRQRIAIARAVLRNPPILILDEATSALDTESEKIVQAALDNLMLNRTAIVIAHRLSTVMKADLILVMQNGRIVERGTHQSLIEQGGLYQKLYSFNLG